MKAAPPTKGPARPAQAAPRTAASPTKILLSQRPHVFYLEHARVVQKDGRVLYLTQAGGDVEQFFNIPQHNTMLVLLGTGTSLTSSAARLLAQAGVMVGFTGSGGSPLYAAIDPVFLPPQDDYRPTQYMHAWMRMWLDDGRRLAVAKKLLKARIAWVEEAWSRSKDLAEHRVRLQDADLAAFEGRIEAAHSTEELLGAKGVWSRSLYARLASGYRLEQFRRNEGLASTASSEDVVNGMLDHGNFVAYGFAAVALHALGIASCLPLLHGRTQRGALVFDIADLFKDALVMPLAFEMGSRNADHRSFRNRLIENIHRGDVVERLIKIIQELAHD